MKNEYLDLALEKQRQYENRLIEIAKTDKNFIELINLIQNISTISWRRGMVTGLETMDFKGLDEFTNQLKTEL